MFINHDDINENMNTDELCEAWTSFIFFNSLEQESDECENDAALLRQRLAGTQFCEWLDKFIDAWGIACDAEYSMGHAIEPSNGWKPKVEGFEHDGIWIADKMKSPCGRFDLTEEESIELYGNR